MELNLVHVNQKGSQGPPKQSLFKDCSICEDFGARSRYVRQG